MGNRVDMSVGVKVVLRMACNNKKVPICLPCPNKNLEGFITVMFIAFHFLVRGKSVS